MHKTKRRSFVAVLLALVCAFVLVFSLGMMSACGNSGSASGEWYYGAAIPSGSLGQEGDFYLNTKTLASYKKSADGWTLMSTEEAPVWHYGTTAPDTQGKEHDFYLNTESGELYQKGAECWGEPILILRGEKGRDGVMWFSGEGRPETSLGLEGKVVQEGDFYIDTQLWVVYQLGSENNWVELGTIKGDKAKDPVRVFDGKGFPDGQVTDPKKGDLYIGQFNGTEDGTGTGSRLYRYDGEKWVVLMESIKTNQIDIHSIDELIVFAQNIKKYDGYDGKEIHLKAPINFNDLSAASVNGRRAEKAAAAWTPIGTEDVPFKGIFDGEGNTISNFTVTTTAESKIVGFFGNVEDATIKHLHFVNAVVTATGEGAIGAVVVGQAKGEVTVRDVTVKADYTTDENAKVGGLVGKLEEKAVGGETKLNVEESSFEGSVTGEGKSVDNFVGDMGSVTEEQVTVTGSSLTDTKTDTTVGWDEGGNHYAEDEGDNRSYFVGSAAEIEALIDKATDGAVGVTLGEDLNLSAQTLTVGGEKKVDLTLDLGGKTLTLNQEKTNAAIDITGGSTLTVKGESGSIEMGRVENKPVFSVSGDGSKLTFDGVTATIRNTYSSSDSVTNNVTPAIVAENGGTVNICGGSSFTAYGKDNIYAYKESQIAAALGKGSTVIVDDADTTIELNNASGLYAAKGGKVHFKNGTIDMKGGSCCVALGMSEGEATIVFSGGTINLLGMCGLTGNHYQSALSEFAIAIGSSAEAVDDGTIIVNGGTINLLNDSGTAIGVGGISDHCIAYVGGGVAINARATESGNAYVAASDRQCTVVNVYSDADIQGIDNVRNFEKPENIVYDEGGIGDGYLCGNLVAFRKALMPSQYTKAEMGIE